MRKRRTLKVFAGVGTRVYSAGRFVSLAAKSGGRWPHPWKCSLSGEEVSIRLGLVNGLEPMLEGRFLSGKDAEGNDDPKGVPFLKLKADLFDETGRSFVCVRYRVDKDGKFPEEKYTEDDLGIIQTASRLMPPGSEGQHILSVLRRAKGESGFGTLKQVAHFDLQHGVSHFAPAGSSPAPGEFRHWFFPA